MIQHIESNVIKSVDENMLEHPSNVFKSAADIVSFKKNDR